MTQCVKGKLDIQKFLENIGMQPNRRQHPMKTLLIQRGIEQRAVAKALSISPSLVSKILNGTVKPSKTVAFNLEALGLFIEKFNIDGFSESDLMSKAA